MRSEFKAIAAIIAAVLLLFIIQFFFFAPKSSPPRLPPNPNGYDTFQAAAKQLQSDYLRTDRMSTNELAPVIANDATNLQSARLGLQQSSMVTIQFSDTYPARHTDDLLRLKKLDYAFAAEGRLAELDDRPGDAAASYLDIIQLGIQSGNGGALIDELVSIAVESVGTTRLEVLHSQLDAKTCRAAVARLETLENQRQSWNDILDQERNWARQTYRGPANRLAWLFTSGSRKQGEQKAAERYHKQQTALRQLIVDLAATAYQRENGKPPASANDLVPKYLKSAPTDPETGSPLTPKP